ncbi:MAG: MFS transporter [Pseudomonadota bacterium]
MGRLQGCRPDEAVQIAGMTTPGKPQSCGLPLVGFGGLGQWQHMSVLSALSVSRIPAMAFVVIGVFWGTFAAMVPVTKARLGVNDAVFGSLLLCSAAGLLTAMFLAPKLEAWLGGRGMQIVAALFAVVMLLPGVVETPLAFALTMVALGLASGTLDVLMNARVSALEAREGRALMNANHGAFSIAYAISAVATGLAREAEIGAALIFGACAVCIAVIAMQLWMPVDAVEAPPDGQGRVPLVPVLLCGAVVLLAFSGEAAVEAWSALHIERTLGGGAVEGALGPAMLGLTMALGRFSGQAVSERINEMRIIVIGTVLAMVGAVLAAVAPSVAVAYLGFGVLGLGVSVIGPIGIGIAGRLVPPWARTVVVARTAVLGFMAFFIAPMVMGVVSEAFGLRVAFLVIGGIVGLIFVFLPGISRLQSGSVLPGGTAAQR